MLRLHPCRLLICLVILFSSLSAKAGWQFDLEKIDFSELKKHCAADFIKRIESRPSTVRALVLINELPDQTTLKVKRHTLSKRDNGDYSLRKCFVFYGSSPHDPDFVSLQGIFPKGSEFYRRINFSQRVVYRVRAKDRAGEVQINVKELTGSKKQWRELVWKHCVNPINWAHPNEVAADYLRYLDKGHALIVKGKVSEGADLWFGISYKSWSQKYCVRVERSQSLEMHAMDATGISTRMHYYFSGGHIYELGVSSEEIVPVIP